ncbi:MAG: hypothetical protein C4576_24565 [Desulfobacteraceae bacterium]|nr:MAG: hypothetical protein C4576_24565 [Desulfobacteraceae bacterium]
MGEKRYCIPGFMRLLPLITLLAFLSCETTGSQVKEPQPVTGKVSTTAAQKGEARAGDKAERDAHFKKTYGISSSTIPIVRHKLPPAGEWVETPVAMNRGYKIRHRTILTPEDLLSLGIDSIGLNQYFLKIDTRAERLLVSKDRAKKSAQAYCLVDLASRECQVTDLNGLPEVNPASPWACFWRENHLLLTKDERSALEVMPESEGRDFWNITRVVPFRKQLPAEWRDWQFGSQAADPDTGTIIRFVRSTKERLKNGKKENDFTIHQLPLQYKWVGGEFRAEFDMFGWRSDMPREACIDTEMKHLSALSSGTNISGGAISKQGFFYLANPLIYAMEEKHKDDIHQFGRHNLATHVWHAPRREKGFGAARYLGRVNTGYIGLEWVLGGGAVSSGGKYAFIRHLLVDLARPSGDHSLKRVAFGDLNKSFKPAAVAFDPSDDRHFYFINSIYRDKGIDYSVVEVYLPDGFDDLMALMGDFLLDECGSDSGLCKAQRDQSAKGFERLAGLLHSRPDIKGRDEALEILLAYKDLWKGRNELQVKTLGQWQNLPGLKTGLKAWILAKRASLLYRAGFREEGADLFRQAVRLDASRIFEKNEHYYMGGTERLGFLKGGPPLFLAGELLLAAAAKDSKEREKSLFDYCLFASAAGQPGLSLQGVGRIRSLSERGDLRLEKQDQDLLALIEATAIAGMERTDEAYSFLLKHGSFDSSARERILKDADLFAALYRDTGKLALILGMDAGKLKRPQFRPVPQAYVDLSGNLIQPATPAPLLETGPSKTPPASGERPLPPPQDKKGAVVLD